MSDKKVFLGTAGFFPTTPPSGDAPLSRRHPGCLICQGLVKPSPLPGSVGCASECLEIDVERCGTRLTFICHGRRDPTRVITIEVVLVDEPDIDDATDGGVLRPFRDIDVVSTVGIPEWQESGVTFTSLEGSLEDTVDFHLGRSRPAPFIAPGRFLLFRNDKGEARTVKIPVAHILVQRP